MLLLLRLLVHQLLGFLLLDPRLFLLILRLQPPRRCHHRLRLRRHMLQLTLLLKYLDRRLRLHHHQEYQEYQVSRRLMLRLHHQKLLAGCYHHQEYQVHYQVLLLGLSPTLEHQVSPLHHPNHPVLNRL
jgi:hypothetical protein